MGVAWQSLRGYVRRCLTMCLRFELYAVEEVKLDMATRQQGSQGRHPGGHTRRLSAILMEGNDTTLIRNPLVTIGRPVRVRIGGEHNDSKGNLSHNLGNYARTPVATFQMR
eukprot:gnl/Chilomastix_caulleri/5474.p1 GENE.gnl/Chilomastix_caulleri/5474~~gnl/Chilomastix_caulleri/5474.p1  ORF type:complete len:111 (-),score=20.56 gnl/Chilomastix_caulleri/5474:167-499(-)